MSAIDDGGSAFPVTAKLMSSEFANIKITETTGGMSLRDYFAAEIMPAIYAKYFDRYSEFGIATSAYRMADAMLAARKEASHD